MNTDVRSPPAGWQAFPSPAQPRPNPNLSSHHRKQFQPNASFLLVMFFRDPGCPRGQPHWVKVAPPQPLVRRAAGESQDHHSVQSSTFSLSLHQVTGGAQRGWAGSCLEGVCSQKPGGFCTSQAHPTLTAERKSPLRNAALQLSGSMTCLLGSKRGRRLHKCYPNNSV